MVRKETQTFRWTQARKLLHVILLLWVKGGGSTKNVVKPAGLNPGISVKKKNKTTHSNLP